MGAVTIVSGKPSPKQAERHEENGDEKKQGNCSNQRGFLSAWPSNTG